MRKMRGILLCLLLFISVVVVAAGAEAKVRVKKVKIKSNYGKIVHVGKGKKVKVSVSVSVKPNRSSLKGVRFQSKNKRIAKINSIGQVKGIRRGTTRVYAISKKNKKKKASIMVKVVKPLKKITFKEKTKTVKIGESFTIKKVVVPSDSGFKGMVWSSSMPSVAKVSSAGKVKALAPGDTKITAKAVDGSGTKAVCAVKVESADTVNISSVRPLSKNTVRVCFDREIALDKTKFNLSGRTSASGNYHKHFTIGMIRNYDNRTYDLRIERGSSIQKNSWIRVSVAELPGNGTKTMEAEALFIREGSPKDVYVLGDADSYIEPLEIDLSDYGCGSLTYQIGNLPEGISASVKDNTIVFTGKTSASYFGKTTVITAVDEMETEVKANVYWYIGSSDSVVGYADPLALVSGEELTESKGSVLHVTGGSGEYEYSFSGLPAGIKGDAQTGTLSGSSQAPGEYDVKIAITDKEDAAKKIVVSIALKIESGFNIFGTVRDSQGSVMPGVKVRFENLEGTNVYTAVTDEKGGYCLRVVRGMYEGMASANVKDIISDEIYEYDVAGDSLVDFYPECYRVNINYDKEVYTLDDALWKSNVDMAAAYEGGDVLYVLPGKYDIVAAATALNKETGETQKYILQAEFVVQDSAVTVNASAKQAPPEQETEPGELTGEENETGSGGSAGEENETGSGGLTGEATETESGGLAGEGTEPGSGRLIGEGTETGSGGLTGEENEEERKDGNAE